MPLRIVPQQNLSQHDRAILFERRQSLEALVPVVRAIMDAVRAEGDVALRRYTERFDGAVLHDLAVSDEEFARAREVLDAGVHEALGAQVAAVRAFHTPQLPAEEAVETAPGVCAWREWRPIERVGLYVPGGRGAYPSSVVMLGVPASIAGCPQIVLCTPPNEDGSVPAATLVAADLVGIHRVFKLGGAQAIAAMTHGTESVPRVDKLFGAGNAYVTAAKLLAFPECSLDAPAGPSELLIIADEHADPRWIAADLLSDMEHGPDSPAVLVTTSRDLAEAVAREVERQIVSLPRVEIARAALDAVGLIVLVDSVEDAAALADRYAPEHLEIVTAAPREVLRRIGNVGSVFLGPYAPNAAGDYATGTNHVLPTARYARTFAPVSVESFGRMIQCQELSPDGLASLARTVGRLAREEGLEAHARAVEARLEGSAF
ncbi:MAG TPA: histidinol dehydrogenase [Chloroflexota bacterium]|jgi:histidinol dehydrogenase